MFIAKKEEILWEIKKINEYLRKCLWMDFVIVQDYGQIEFYGALSQSWNNFVDSYAIKLVFEGSCFVSTLFDWTIDTSGPSIELCTKEEENELTSKYRIESGNYFFKINVEDFENPPIFICAKKLTSVILKENPFPER